MYHAFTDYLAFNRVIGVANVGELNLAIAHKEAPMLINVAEALHDKKIGRISDEIQSRYNEGGARVVLIAGPSSSGKTTFTKRLAIQLMTNLLEPKMISLDDYFVNREDTPREPDGDYDYESLYARPASVQRRPQRPACRGGSEAPDLQLRTWTTCIQRQDP